MSFCLSNAKVTSKFMCLPMQVLFAGESLFWHRREILRDHDLTKPDKSGISMELPRGTALCM